MEWLGYEAGVSASEAFEKGVEPGVGRPLLAGLKDMVEVEGEDGDWREMIACRVKMGIK